ncbi:MAG: four-carbon acid sugar kinase family protein [Litoreibacter sp.]|nr:four-carbon acid sugar kinase family protein [Litoreibacter sp.]
MAVMGCIADDFTGATDLAGLLARSGASVNLRIGIPEAPAGKTADFEVIALKSRTAPVGEAVSETLRALDWLKSSGADRFFWKYCSTFDSTPEGNIGPVSEALMSALGVAQTIYCPAFPENGRAIFMGNLFVGEEPLAESPMKDHPLTPMRDSNLMRLLTPQVTGEVGLANRLVVERGAAALKERLSALLADGVPHVIVDAVSDSDLAVIAEACADMGLITGGSAVAMPLPNVFRAKRLLAGGESAPIMKPVSGGSLVLSGSCSATTRAQVGTYLKQASGYRLDPLVLAEAGPEGALNWLAEQPSDAPKIVYATAEPDAVRAAQDKLGRARAGEVVEQALAACAVAARSSGISRIVVAGGESSGAVTQALGVDSLSVGAEIAPGVPWCFAHSEGREIALALKSGNFGSEDFFAGALSMLETS